MTVMKQSSRRRAWFGGFLCGACALAAVAIVVRTFFVQGLVAKVETSSGSMAPWLIGPHGRATCNSCAMSFVFDALDTPARDDLDCPNCGRRTAHRQPPSTVAGEQVLIDRSTFAMRPPRRWEPVVFRCPDQPGMLCIKRVVGLPGEEVQIRGGDVYIDGRIARKPLAVQRDLAILVHDTRYRGPDGEESASKWYADSTSGWQLDRDGFRFQPTESANDDCSGTLLFKFCRCGKSLPVSDDYGYNQNASRHWNRVDDLMFEFDATLRHESELSVEVDGHGLRVAITLGDGHASTALRTHNGRVVASQKSAVPLGDHAHVVASFFDRQMVLAIDGTPLLQVDVPDLAPSADAAGRQQILLRARGSLVEVSNMRLLRDIYYTRERTSQWGTDAPYRLGDAEFFVLGDNSPISADSRSWPSAGIASSSIVGKPLRSGR